MGCTSRATAGLAALAVMVGAGPATGAGGHTHAGGQPAAAGHAGSHGGGHAPAAAVDVAPGAAPRLDVSLRAAAGGGFDVALEVRGLRFAPENADGAHVAGEGHAHLYVDGEKIARVVAATHALPALAPGTHHLRVALFTNDHRGYSAGGVPVGRSIVLRVPPPERVAEPGPAVRHAVRIAGGRATPGSARVHQGDLVGLEFASDAVHTLHLHGYDVEAEVAPGAPVAVYLVAHASGRFPVESHGVSGGHGHATLFQLEVYPR